MASSRFPHRLEMRLLFVKPSLLWPRSNGQDVYCFYMMKALVEQGAQVGLLTASVPTVRAVENIPISFFDQLQETHSPTDRIPLTRSQARFTNYWGINPGHIDFVRERTVSWEADVVIAFGLPALPYLAGAGKAVRVWAMLDEWVYHHISLIRTLDASTWPNFRTALIKGLYERSFSGLVDRAWAVSDNDRWAGRWLAGFRNVDLLPNGVDTDYFAPTHDAVIPNSAVFWGRLDFEPNIDAVTWFLTTVWPRVRAQVPSATFTVAGFAPPLALQELCSRTGVTLMPDVEDLRSLVCQHAVVALPMVSGGGIKNKLLEGAAMGRPIVATHRATLGLRPRGQVPVVHAEHPSDWISAFGRLWSSPAEGTALGTRAREWVSNYYGWSTPAKGAMEGFESSLRERRKQRGLPR